MYKKEHIVVKNLSRVYSHFKKLSHAFKFLNLSLMCLNFRVIRMDIHLIKLVSCISDRQFQTTDKYFLNQSWGRNSAAWRSENEKHHENCKYLIYNVFLCILMISLVLFFCVLFKNRWYVVLLNHLLCHFSYN